jgi:ABC-2 type transport system ATP-binding protein
MDSVMVEVKDLTMRYGERTALNGINLAVDRGELFGLLGPNGAGKTTLISILSTLLKPSSGQVKIGSLDVLRHGKEIKHLIGTVPQEIALYPTLSARENLSFYGRMYGIRGSRLKKRIDELLETVGLTDRKDERVQKFSGGMKRRLNLAVGLLHEPKLLLLDEPMVGVDPQSRNQILQSTRTLKSEGTGAHLPGRLRRGSGAVQAGVRALSFGCSPPICFSSLRDGSCFRFTLSHFFKH